jgi:succinate dehydrogenase assembly factor 2
MLPRVLHAPRPSRLLRALSSAAASRSQAPVEFKPPASLTTAHVSRVEANDAAMRAAYDALPAGAPLLVRRKRLAYRSKQRGWLEVDLLMGSFADAHLGALDAAGLDAYEAILNRETLDLYNMITGKDDAPVELRGAVLDAIKAHVASSPLGRADPAKYAQMKEHFTN